MNDNPLQDFGAGADSPARLRGRVEDSLQQQGLIAPRRSFRSIALAAAIVLAASLGFIAGRARPAVAADEPQFMLFIVGGTARINKPVEEIIAEYSRWADSLQRAGRLVSAEKLADIEYSFPDSSVVPLAPPERSIGGYYLVRAPDLNAASAIVRASPHLRYGGRVVLRPVDRMGR